MTSRRTLGESSALYMLVVVALLAMAAGTFGCAGHTTPAQGVRESLAAAYATVEIAANTTARLHQAGRITDAERAEIKGELEFVVTELEFARTAMDEAPAGAAVSHQVLQALHAAQLIAQRLQAREATP